MSTECRMVYLEHFMGYTYMCKCTVATFGIHFLTFCRFSLLASGKAVRHHGDYIFHSMES